MSKKVTRIYLHVAQHMLGQVLNSVDVDRHQVEMTLAKDGVEVKGKNTDKLVPFSNLQSIDFAPVAVTPAVAK